MTAIVAGEHPAGQRIEDQRLAARRFSAMRRIGVAAGDGAFDKATEELAQYRDALMAVQPKLQAALPWSLFHPAIRQAHYAALRQRLVVGHALPK